MDRLATVRPAALPPAYRILPHAVPLWIPGFTYWNRKTALLTLTATGDDCPSLFSSFTSRVLRARDQGDYLPVMRMSDGEYRFLLGRQPPSSRLGLAARVSRRMRDTVRAFRDRGAFSAATAPGVSSGEYSHQEIRALRNRALEGIRHVADAGILALHLTFGAQPFQEHYHPALGHLLEELGLVLSEHNYVPFYFVYALLAAGEGRRLIEGQRVLLVNGASASKQALIERRLIDLGGLSVSWCTISPQRSLVERPDIDPWRGKTDIVFVGAGVGKLTLFPALAPLAVPIIDAGYMFEVWHDRLLAQHRNYCFDDSFDLQSAGPLNED